MQREIPVSEQRLEMLVRSFDALQSLVASSPSLRGSDELIRRLEQLEQTIARVQLKSIHSLEERFQGWVQEVAQELGKSVRAEVSGLDIELDEPTFQVLCASLIHLVRNAVDHGVETPQIRKRKGKGPEGRVRLSTQLHGGFLKVMLSDDGQGFQEQAVRARAVELGWVTDAQWARLSPGEKFAFLFRSGFTTRSQVTSTSGRGVGLDAVEAWVKERAGRIGLQNTGTQGFGIGIELPLETFGLPSICVRLGSFMFFLPAHSVIAQGGGRVPEGEAQSESALEFTLKLREILGQAAESEVTETSAWVQIRDSDGKEWFLNVDASSAMTLRIFRKLDETWAALAPPEWQALLARKISSQLHATRIVGHTEQVGIAPLVEPALFKLLYD